MQIVTKLATATVATHFEKDTLNGSTAAYANASEMPQGFLNGFTAATKRGFTYAFKRTYNQTGYYVFKATDADNTEFVVRRKR